MGEVRSPVWPILAAALALAAGPALAQTAPPPPASPPPKWGPHLDLEGKAGNKRHIGEADAFVPIWQDGATLLFGNVKARLDDNASSEGNYGLGLRHMLEAGWNLGAYGYFDRRRTEHANYFNQATFGVEALSVDWDFRANAYIPEGRRSKNVDGLSTADVEGTSVIFRGGEERSLRGFDVEAGWRVPVFARDAGQQLRVYGGGYRFYADGVNPVQGPRGRMEMVFDEIPQLWEGARLAVGGELQHDGPRRTTGFLSARLRIPLQAFGGGAPPARLTPMERRMTDPVVRDIDVVAQAGTFTTETATATAGGSAITVLSSVSTTGANLPTAVANAGANSTVILSGSFSTTATTTLQAGQTLMGAGSLQVRSPSGRVATLTTPAATINGTPAGTAGSITMGNNSTLSGMTINDTDSGATNAVGIRADGVSGATIANNTVTASITAGVGSAQALLIAGGASNITVSGNSLTASNAASNIAIAIQVNGSSATVTGNTLSGTGVGGGANIAYTLLSTANILSGSSGNTANAGACTVSVAGTGGTVTYTNAAACGP